MRPLPSPETLLVLVPARQWGPMLLSSEHQIRHDCLRLLGGAPPSSSPLPMLSPHPIDAHPGPRGLEVWENVGTASGPQIRPPGSALPNTAFYVLKYRMGFWSDCKSKNSFKINV